MAGNMRDAKAIHDWQQFSGLKTKSECLYLCLCVHGSSFNYQFWEVFQRVGEIETEKDLHVNENLYV